MKRKVVLQVEEISALEATKRLKPRVILPEKHGVDLSRDIELQGILRPTDIEKLRSCLEKEV